MPFLLGPLISSSPTFPLVTNSTPQVHSRADAHAVTLLALAAVRNQQELTRRCVSRRGHGRRVVVVAVSANAAAVVRGAHEGPH
jgi:hypothetical protein